MARTSQGQFFLRVLLWIAIVLVALVVMPFVGSLFAAAVFATVLFPVQRRLAARFGDRPKLAATTITAGVSLLVLLPLVGFGFVAGQRIAHLVDDIVEIVERDGVEGLVAELPENLQPLGRRAVEAISSPPPNLPTAEQGERSERHGDAAPDQAERPEEAGQPEQDEPPAEDAPPGHDGPQPSGEGARGVPPIDEPDLGPVDSKAVVNQSARLAQDVFTWLIGFLIDLGILVVALYFLLAEGRGLVAWLVDTVPLSAQRTQQFLDEFRRVTVAVFRSTVLSAFAQTAAAAIGYLIAGTPMLLIVLTLTLVGAFVPVIGGGTIVVLVALVTMLVGSTGWGIFLLAWGCLPVALSDNLLRPLLASDRLHLPGSVLFFAMFGGLALMGPMGVIGGPLVVSFFLVVLRALRTGRPPAPDVPAPTAEAASPA